MRDDFMICDQEEDKKSIRKSIEGGALETWVAFFMIWGGTMAIVAYKIISG